MDKKYRHELSLIMDIDSNSIDNNYYIRSLYFDDIYSTAYYEKIDGLEKREKYRIRIYNFDDSLIRLERKEKNRDLTHKEQAVITKDELNNILQGNYDLIDISKNKLLEEFILKCKLYDIRPDVIVDYNRLAYVYQVEDVRITFDENIKSGRFNYDLFNKDIYLYNVLENNEVVLEVKFNNYIPKHIVEVLNTIPSVRLAVSKFALCKEIKEVL